MGLYDLSDIVPSASFPSASFRARDLIRGGEPVLINEHSATQTLFAQSEERYAHVIERGRKTGPPLAVVDWWAGTDEELQRAVPWFTTTRVFDVLTRAPGITRPRLLNSDGDEAVFHTVTFPLTPGAAREELTRRLSTLPSLREETPPSGTGLDRHCPGQQDPVMQGRSSGTSRWKMVLWCREPSN